MSTSDKEIVAMLAEKMGITISSRDVAYDAVGNLISLNLSRKGLSDVPLELGKLNSLQRLDVDNNQLSAVPKELGQLSSLQVLNLSDNHLSTIPSELGQLSSLQWLYLHYNQLATVPPELGQLKNLQWLYLHNNHLSMVPPELGKLSGLGELSLDYNQLRTLPSELWKLSNLQRLSLDSNQLSMMPPELGQLNSLRVLSLTNNQLHMVPPELGKLSSLQTLYLNDNQLRIVPPELGKLSNLQFLNLDHNQLITVPPELGKLNSLQRLDLDNNQLSMVPPELGQLSSLQRLDLDNNQLSMVPPELGQLSNLQKLYLNYNKLSMVPPELGQLRSLRELYLDNNQLMMVPTELWRLSSLELLSVANNSPIKTLPIELITKGTRAMLSFLRELEESGTTRYEAKLLVVGEGGTGKSSLLRALRNQSFEQGLSTTHGIEVDQLVFPHPQQAQTSITLNTWDFGGQQIYHATHQFFLTSRSVYLVTWNARLGVEQGRLHYWSETIKALAPNAPVLLVATHIDERAPDLNYAAFKEAYPQLTGHVSISNLKGTGIEQLQAAIAELAMELPIMGQPWPQKWLRAEEHLLARPEHHIAVQTYLQDCMACGIEEDVAKGTLGSYLHDLGKILYFQDDEVLSNLVVLKPNWVTKAISNVLTDESVRNAQGILQHTELQRIWAHDDEGHPYSPYLYRIFLRLMERFYLSYQIAADAPGALSTRSLIPQLLPYQPPVDLPPWPKVPPEGQTQIEMIYTLSFVPAGIMSWFIVRTHLYTLSKHWREGVLLGYQEHYARVELYENRKEIRLLAWGQQPHNFFTILMNTLDVILDFFKGLTVRREIPCICHWHRPGAAPCPHFYRYEELVRRMEARRYTIECAESFESVSVQTLLFGIHSSTDQQVMESIQKGQQEVLAGQHTIQQSLVGLEKLDLIMDMLRQQSELICRNFTRQWNVEMKKIEAECPNTFFLKSGQGKWFNPKNWVSEPYQLYLLCQHPPGPHQVGDGYTLRKGEDWWITVSPWLQYVMTFLKYAMPLGSGVDKLLNPDAIKQFQDQLDLLTSITNDLSTLALHDTMKPITENTRNVETQRSVGPALRALHAFLKEADPNERWGDLNKILTPDGNILWLCGQHRQQYEARQAGF